MRILRIYTRIPPCKGGMEKHIFHLSEEQRKLGHDVKIYFNQGEATSKGDVRVTSFTLDRTKPRFLGMIFFHILIVLRLIFQREKFDVIHIHGDWSSLVLVKTIKGLTKAKKVAFSIHDDIKDTQVYSKLFKFFLQGVDIIFSTGYDTAQKIKLMTKKKVVFQPSGVNNIFFEPYEKNFDKARLQVITVANLVDKKNIDLVLDIAKEIENMDFIIVGEGPNKARLKQRIECEKISNVVLMGYKSVSEVRELYRQSDIFLLTSLKEGTPTALLEAMACKLIVISSGAGGISSIINNGINGYIINSYSKKEYIDILLKFDDKILKKIYFNENTTLNKKFEWKYISNYITKHYQIGE